MRGLFIWFLFGVAAAFVSANFEQDWENFKITYGRHYDSIQEESWEHNENYEKGEITRKMGINNFIDMTEEDMESFNSEWENFKMKYNKKYSTPEMEAYRKGIFFKNLEEIKAHNKKYEKGEVTWKKGVNDFTDLSFGEFAKIYLGGVPNFSEEEFQKEWKDFKTSFGRNYENSIEEHFRKGIFRVNWEKIVQHNRKYAKGEVTWKMGTNNFTDWTGDESGSHLKRPMFAYSTSFDGEWEEFKAKYGRSYENPEEEAFRKGIFLKNWEVIIEHNKKFKNGEVSWQMGVNNFTDYTQEEFGKRLMNPPKFSKEQFETDWKDFKTKYSRVYENPLEEAFRRGIFHWNWEKIVKHNEKYEKGEISWKMGVNNFTDWTQEEFGTHIMPSHAFLNINDF